MRLLLILLTVATSVTLTNGHPILRCTASSTKLFTDNLSAASGSCTDSLSYVWNELADPTDEQRAVLCKCAVRPFDVPKCYWIKQNQFNIQFNVPTSEHFGFAYNCSSISGKSTPTVTEVDTASTPTPTTQVAEAAAPCSVQQSSVFTSALKTASGGCLGDTPYNWTGSSNPTKAQYSEICKCASVSSFTIPTCSVQKGPDTVTLEKHYNWVRTTQCPTFAPSDFVELVEKSSNNVGLIAGIAGGVVIVLLLIVVFLYKRNRKIKQEQHTPHNDLSAVQSPGYQPSGATPPINAKIEEQRLQLELKREHREQARERYQIEILEAQVRKEKHAAEKEAYGARVQLMLSRKQLRDQGVSEDEIDRILPVEAAAKPPAAVRVRRPGINFWE